MEFKLAQAEHLDELCRITADAKAQMRRLKLDQWQRGYPCREDWARDIAARRIFIAVEDGCILGAFLFQTVPDASYAVIDGAWLSDAPYATMHRVCVAETCKGQGIAGKLFTQGLNMAREQGFASVRIDTHEENRPMRRALEKAGFTLCGTVRLKGGCEDGSPRVTFEYLL